MPLTRITAGLFDSSGSRPKSEIGIKKPEPSAERSTSVTKRSLPTQPRPRAVGRPEKYTPEVHDRIVLAVRAGNYLKVAAASAGIGESTLLRWMTNPRYRGLEQDVRRAQAEFEVRTVGRINQRIDDYPVAGMKLLARRMPSRWGNIRDTGPGPADEFPETAKQDVAETRSAFADFSSDWLRVIARLYVAARKGETPVQFMERMDRGMDPGLREGDPPRRWYEPPEPDDEETPPG